MSPERVDSGHVIFKYAEVLPDIERLLRVDGVLELELFASDVFAEVYCGCASVTLAATVHGVPAVFPWDIELGSQYNVCSGGWRFFRLSLAKRLADVHIATPCRSLTWSRKPQLRTWQQIFGCMRAKQAQLIHSGNLLAMFTVLLAVLQLMSGGYFHIENPMRSWLWLLPWFLNLRHLVGVGFTQFFFSDFLMPWAKATGLLHCVPTVHALDKGQSDFQASIPLRGQVLWQGEWQFLTHIAQPYPPDFALELMRLVAQALQLREQARLAGESTPLATCRRDLPARPPTWFLRAHNVIGPDAIDVRDMPVHPGHELRQAAAVVGIPLDWASAFLPNADGVAPVEQIPFSQADFGRPFLSDSGAEDGEDLELDDDASDASSDSGMPGLADAYESESETMPDDTLVEDGGGATRGMSAVEHVRWAMANLRPPDPLSCDDLDNDTWHALEFETSATPDEVDDRRLSECLRLLDLHRSLEGERQAWLQAAPEHSRLILSEFHGPFFDRLLQEVGHEDSGLAWRMFEGFKLVGQMEPSGPEVSGAPARKVPLSLSGLRSARRESNEAILAQVSGSQYEDKLREETLKDIQLHSMSELEELTETHLETLSLSRRFVVVQWCAARQDWKYRIVDDLSESGINDACQPVDRTTCQTLDKMLRMSAFVHRAGQNFTMWKRDVKRAFRNCPVLASQHEFCGCVLVLDGRLYVCKQLALPFGAVGSVLGWHRVGSAMSSILTRLLLVPHGRYVDDYFGLDVPDVEYTGGRCADFLFRLVGLPLDGGKAEDDRHAIVILGARLRVDHRLRAVSTRVSEDKAKKWSDELVHCFQEDKMDSGMASKHAGRCSFAVTIAYDKVGRAYIRPFHRQARAPRPYLTSSLRASVLWWHAFLTARPERWHFPSTRREHAIVWTDASGEDGRIAAVLAIGDLIWFTHMDVPDWFYAQLETRGDLYIGVLETLALWLAIETFEFQLKTHAVSFFCDNRGVMFGIARGSSRSQESSFMIAKFWIWCAVNEVAAVMYYVESKANISDGPTRPSRQFLSELLHLGAVEVDPALPEWCSDIWADPSLQVFAQELEQAKLRTRHSILLTLATLLPMSSGIGCLSHLDFSNTVRPMSIGIGFVQSSPVRSVSSGTGFARVQSNE